MSLFEDNEAPKPSTKFQKKTPAAPVDEATTEAPIVSEPVPTVSQEHIDKYNEEIKVNPKMAVYKEGEKPDPALVKTPEQMRNYLFSYPKVKVYIPLVGGEKPGTREPVLVNGVRIDILKGTMVDVPQPFADQVFNFLGNQIEMLGAEKVVGSDQKRINALS